MSDPRSPSRPSGIPHAHLLHLEARMAMSMKGDLSSDDGAPLVCDVEFTEGPV
ncbi:hypothetical protein AB0B79_38095 [Streptomyces sp. NPDC039022]|uniref:hypothetical protein n=1 Tax=unclassified Streptomyces TaxID=2593676 RepID=UPI0033D17EA1